VRHGQKYYWPECSAEDKLRVLATGLAWPIAPRPSAAAPDAWRTHVVGVFDTMLLDAILGRLVAPPCADLVDDELEAIVELTAAQSGCEQANV
jgi:hypothetical protein